MKTKILSEKQEQIIDWDKPQWFISKKGLLLLSTGKHSSDEFQGTALPYESYPNGEFADDWGKSKFTPITELTIKISNL